MMIMTGSIIETSNTKDAGESLWSLEVQCQCEHSERVSSSRWLQNDADGFPNMQGLAVYIWKLKGSCRLLDNMCAHTYDYNSIALYNYISSNYNYIL